ncbi:serine/threonine-protein kinase HipA [Flagellimonas taeanensis]|jgi:serine/threonine-protein kinase HipA|uniref:Serine/threonine-protein kinase HipA n=1 Tax=Flagellimonas taeanensis TaxID=1005926 RepID=A0A1M6WDC5_9FLAO|nr:type II toxin-antitoxin system HipA family toxin [Allomuricauda taeanensis]SFC44336.1 serine/threonine-protein kinase HipA [Allomuricauda taeanensis]SHK91576.1 serine/threonine-protein kinase HipA [Allomuricauda taeanensis]
MVDVAEVLIWGELVGAVRWDASEQLGYFQYDPKFLQKNWDLSPIKMPLAQGSRIYSFPELRKGRNQTEDAFKGLPGLLSDALPDAYGNKLINIWLAQRGRPENSMNPVEKLCFIGKRGMGALEFDPAQISTGTRSFSLELDSLVEVAKKMLQERESFLTHLKKDEEKAMMEILKIGTSAGGARPKAVIAYNSKTGEVRSGQGYIPKGFEHYLLKLDGVSGAQFGESSGWGRVEYAYYLMAKDCGIEISESQLLEENGRAHFMTKRFDREGNVKHHVQSLCGIQHYDFNDMQGYSYEQVFQTMRLLRLTYPEAEQMFRRMVFNVLATNYDDHTKNFSFILKKDGDWRLAPAFDLCFSFDPTNHWVNQQTLSVHGKRVDIGRDDLMTIAKDNNIKKGGQIIEQANEIVKSWDTYAHQAEVRKDLRDRIHKNLNTL